MGSKLTLRFISEGAPGYITPAPGMTYTFKVDRLAVREVSVGPSTNRFKAEALARNFYEAFKVDDNYHNLYILVYTVTSIDHNGIALPAGQLHGIVTIEHPQNGYFDGQQAPVAFILASVENTASSTTPTLTVNLSQSPTDICGKVLITANTNVVSGRVAIEIPAGNTVYSENTDSSGNHTVTIDRLRPSVGISGIVKVYATAFTTTIAKSQVFTVPGVLSISEVKILASPFGAMANIISSGTDLEYSLNQTTWQGSASFPSLLTGTYTAYVRDSYGCIKSMAFEVLPEHTTGISIPGMIHFPIHNSLRAAYRGGSEIFTNFLAIETPGITPLNSHFQEYLAGDMLTMQFKSSYQTHRALFYDCAGNETEMVIQKLSNNISRVNIYEGNYTVIDGKVAVFFTGGNIYNPDGSTQDYGHDLNGLLPKWYQSNVFLNIDGLGTTKINRVIFDEDLEIVYAITEIDGAGDALGVKITSIHTENPYEIYEFQVNLIVEGKFVLKVEYDEGEIWFEPVLVRNSLPDRYLKVEWYSDENNDIIYSTGIRQLRRLPWVKYFTYKSTNEKEIFKSDTTVRNIMSKSYATYELAFRPMPMEMARGLDYGFNAAGTIVEINGAQFVCDGAVNVVPMGAYYKVTVELTLIGQAMSAPQFGVGDSFLIVDENANGVAFLRI